MFGVLLISSKSGYFLGLIDSVAPMIDIIGKIFSDMRWFMVVITIFSYSFAGAFYMLGKNQVDYDGLSA